MLNFYKSTTTARFRKLFAELPDDVQKQARDRYRTFRKNPNHPSLDFKQYKGNEGYCAARVNDQYRVVGSYGPEIVWFWIGTKNEAKKLF